MTESGTKPSRQPVLPDDEDLIARVRAKAAALARGDVLPTISPQKPTEGLGALFGEERPWVSAEDLDARCEAAVGAGDPLWDDLTAQMLEESCAFFAQEILTGPPGPPYHGRFLLGPHHIEWDELIADHKRICILASRDHGKTFFWNFAYPLWRASREPRGIGYIFSATQNQADRILGDITYEIENNPKLQWLKPGKTKRHTWSRRTIHLSNGHRIYARGFGTKIRGYHPSWIVVDDGLNDEDVYSEMVRQKHIDYFYTAITNMLIPEGQLIVVGTPFHALDLYGDLEKNKEYEFRRYAATPEKPLWPARYGRKRLEQRKAEIGNVRFTREFECLPISDEMSLFPGYLFRGDPTEQPMVKLGMPLEYWNEVGVTIFMGGDFAMSSSVSADYTVIFTMGLDNRGNRWIIDIQRRKGLGYQDQLSLINTIARRYEPALIFLEDNQMQRIFGDELIRTTDLPIKKFTTTAQKNTLDKGVPSLRVLLENGKFRIPRGDKYSVEMTDIWIAEMQSFTWQDGKLQGVGANDDTVMGCWICDQAIRQGGFTFAFGPEEGEEQQTLDEMLKEMTGDPDEKKKESKEGEATSKDEKASDGSSGNLVDSETVIGLPSGLHLGYHY